MPEVIGRIIVINDYEHLFRIGPVAMKVLNHEI